MAKSIYLYWMLSMIMLSCKGQKNMSLKITDSDTIPREIIIPYYEDSSIHGSGGELFLKNLGRIIGLPTISNGNDGLYVRIWLWGAAKKYVINISNDRYGKICNIVEFNSKKMDSGEFLIIHRELKGLIPKSGWTKLFSTLEEYQIPYLESGKIHNVRKESLTQMAFVQFEIARPNQYRFYEYLEPSFYREIDIGSKNVYQFLEYFNKETNVEVYTASKNMFIKKP